MLRVPRKQQIITLRNLIKNRIYLDKLLKQQCLLNRLIMEELHAIVIQKHLRGYLVRLRVKNKSRGCNKDALKNEDLIILAINNKEGKIISDLRSFMGLSSSEILAMKIKKENGFQVKHSLLWDELKKGTGERGASSKSDIGLKNDDKLFQISIKSGKGRLTSSDCHETCAIFKSVFQNKYNRGIESDDELKIIIDTIIQLMKDLGKKIPINKQSTVNSIKREIKLFPDLINEDKEWIKKLIASERECNKLWGILKNSHVDYVKDILYECASGEYKFGNNDGRAHWLIVTKNSKSQEIDKIFNLNKRSLELDSYLWNSAKSPNAFKAKTGGTGKIMWMRFL